jgi:hypothetical protein
LDQRQNKLVLQEDRIVETVARLQRRISDRFPGSSLSALCGDLLEVAEQASERSAWIGSPIRSLRAVGYTTAFVLVVFFIGFVVYELQPAPIDQAIEKAQPTADAQAAEAEKVKLIDLVSAIEAGLNIIILLALTIWFFVSLETRIKRRRAIAAVHELRSLSHVIDMHQLTKDPERVLREWSGTENSPKERITAQELNRYLDYCSEMLSLIGKIASLYIQRFDDSEAVAVVSEVEQLSTGLSRKIWQKIMILNQTRDMQVKQPDESKPNAAEADAKSTTKQAS